MTWHEYQDTPLVTVDDYLASSKTFAIASYQYKDQLFSIVYDVNGKYLVKKKPLHIVRDSCRSYGFTYDERVNQAKRYIQNKHKLPVVIEHDFNVPVILFPLYSAKSEHNIWLSTHAIQGIFNCKTHCNISFPNDKLLSIPVTHNVVNTQYACACAFSRKLQVLKFERRLQHFEL